MLTIAPPAASRSWMRRSSTGVCAASISTPTKAPARTSAVHGKDHETAEAGDRNDVGQDRRRQKRRAAASGRAASRSAVAAVAAAKISARARLEVPSRQSSAATTIDGPMMLRMSTLNRSVGRCDHPRIQAWSRKRKASAKTSSPRRTTAFAAPLRLPVLRSFDPADNATATPARKRNSVVPPPPMIISTRKAEPSRSGAAGPAVEQVSVDHQQHGDAAQPVEMFATPWRLAGSDAHPRPD